MSKFDNKSNSELYTLLKEMEMTHEKVKDNILKQVSKLEQIEKDFESVRDELKKRVKH